MKCASVYDLFFYPGEVTEIRAFGTNGKSKAWEGWSRGTVFGYFDNPDAFGEAATALDKAGARGIYFTVNPCNPDFMAKAANRLRVPDEKTALTQDKDILCIRWLLLDLDAKYAHENGVSASADELKQTLLLRNEIYKWLVKEFAFDPGVPACSGNGAHLMYMLPDLPNTDETKELIKDCLKALNHKWNNDGVDIDLSVFNPARIWKLYGTTARKGDQYKDRIHRSSYVEPKFLKIDEKQAELPGGDSADGTGA
jgi:hypothetical protein